MAEFPTLPLFTDAYLADTRHLTAAQHGAYLLLLMMAWRLPDCALPDDDETLARWAAMDVRTWRKNKSTIMAFWHKGDDGKFCQKRLADERKRVEQQRSKNVAAGRISALKRHERGSTGVQPKSNVNSTIPKPEPYKKEDTNVSSSAAAPKSPPAKQPKAQPESNPDFEKFWAVYPRQRRGAKDKAQRAWLKAIAQQRATPEEIQRAVELYAASDEVARGFAKGCEAWLNDDRWTFDYSAPRPQAANSGGKEQQQKQDYYQRTIEGSLRALGNIEKGQT